MVMRVERKNHRHVGTMQCAGRRAGVVVTARWDQVAGSGNGQGRFGRSIEYVHFSIILNPNNQRDRIEKYAPRNSYSSIAYFPFFSWFGLRIVCFTCGLVYMVYCGLFYFFVIWFTSS
jgi:hypothetical protein